MWEDFIMFLRAVKHSNVEFEKEYTMVFKYFKCFVLYIFVKGELVRESVTYNTIISMKYAVINIR